MLLKEIKAGNVVLADTVSMYIVNQVGKIQRHGVQGLDFIADVLVAKFNKGTKGTAVEFCVDFCILPYKLSVTVVVNLSNAFNLACKVTLNDNLSVRVNHEFVRITLGYRNVNEGRKLFHKKVAAVKHVVRIVPKTAGTHDFIVQCGNLLGKVVNLLNRSLNVAVNLVANAAKSLVLLLNGRSKGLAAYNNSLAGCIAFRICGKFLPCRPVLVHVGANGNIIRLVIDVFNH